jgi:lipopolysaccharide biosynthesis regulator YciM
MLLRGSTYFGAIGDTATLVLVAARLQQVGQLSAMGRDQRGYHYPLALLALARGDTARAEAEFRAAVLTAAEGYTRINLQLGQLLLAERRPAEAVTILRPILDADFLSGSTFYVTATEVHEALGQAFTALDRPDSARAHYAFVARAWEHADPQFQSRLAAARAYLAAHPAP